MRVSLIILAQKKGAAMFRTLFAILIALVTSNAFASGDAQLERGRAALRSMTGCYLIDYSYAETEALKPGYVRDSRVYDVNRDKSVKEWIYAEELSNHRIRLQHILFATDLDGTLMGGSELKHQVEE